MTAISVIVCTFNHESFVEESLESVAKQSFRDFELIIVDDCSSDGTADRIREWAAPRDVPVTIIVNETNVGICASRNRALTRARAKYVSTLSGDDVYERDKLERQYRAFESCPAAVAVVYSDVTVIDADGHPLVRNLKPLPPAPLEGNVFEALLEENFIRAPAVMMRRSALDEVGGYDESLAYEDFDLWLRLADRFEFRFCPGRITRRRILMSSLSHAPKYRFAILESQDRVLTKWYGRDAERDSLLDASRDRVANHAWRVGRRRIVDDRDDGLRLLDLGQRIHPTLRHRLFLTCLHLPGAVHALRLALAVRDRLRRG